MTFCGKSSMKKATIRHSMILLFMAVFLLPISLLSGPAGYAAGEEHAPEPVYRTAAEMKGMTFAFVKGSVYDKYVEEHIENTKCLFYPSLSDCIAAVEAGKADGAVQRSYALQLAVNRRGGKVAMLPETLADMEEEYFFKKGDPRLKEFNAAIAKLMEDGTIAELTEKWAAADDEGKTLPEQDWEAPNGTLRLATTGSLEPFSYPGADGRATGFDVDLALHICREMGCHLKTEIVSMDSIVAAVDSGKADVGGTLTYTEERAKAVDFSDSVMPVAVSVVVKAKSAAGTGGVGFFGRIAESFHRTFIEESRWKLLLKGLGTTLFISVLAGVFGLILGYLTVLLLWSRIRWCRRIVEIYHSLLGSIPIVVVLMVLYYIVFGSSSIRGDVVAAIAFTLSFGAASGTTMWTAVSSIDRVQEESGLALGYTSAQTFHKIIFPQAALSFLPQLQSQFVSLVKDTAIVGFIAVNDLTRAADLIRTRTLEAFFPLIATAVIYYLVCRFVAAVLRRVFRKVEIENRPRTIKGVTL